MFSAIAPKLAPRFSDREFTTPLASDS